MAAFKTLRDVSNNFEKETRKVLTELFSAKIDETFEDIIAKKTRDVALFNSKLRLLQAKPLAETPEVVEINKNEHTTINDYMDTVDWKIIEQQVVKTLTQTHFIKNLITSSNRNLDPELVDRKEKIIEQLTKYGEQETHLRHLVSLLQEKEDQLLQAQQVWDDTLWKLKDSQEIPEKELEDDLVTGPIYKRLQGLVKKMELMRWLISKLVTSRTGGYDWATDPHKRLNALALARRRHTIQDYTES